MELGKQATIMLITILAATSIVMAGHASGTTKPSTPEFTSKYIDLSYDVPPTYGIDPYTGKTVTTQDSYHIDNRSIQFTIKNQPFTTYMDPSGNQTGLYYNFRIKGAYGTEWDYYPFAPNGISTNRYGGPFDPISPISPASKIAQSNTEYTTITIKIPGVYRVPTKAQLEVQVQAIAGYMVYQDRLYVFIGESSDWSPTQTLTIGKNTSATASPSASPTTAPQDTTAPETEIVNQNAALFGLDLFQIAMFSLIVIIAVLLAVAVAYLRKKSLQGVKIND
jgi:hypothetical protein